MRNENNDLWDSSIKVEAERFNQLQEIEEAKVIFDLEKIEPLIREETGEKYDTKTYTEWYKLWLKLLSIVGDEAVKVVQDREGKLDPVMISQFIKIMQNLEILNLIENKAGSKQVKKVIELCRQEDPLSRSDSQLFINTLLSEVSPLYTYNGESELSASEYLNRYYSFLGDIKFSITLCGYDVLDYQGLEETERIYNYLIGNRQGRISLDHYEQFPIAKITISHNNRDFEILVVGLGLHQLAIKNTCGIAISPFKKDGTRFRYGMIFVNNDIGFDKEIRNYYPILITRLIHEIDHMVKNCLARNFNINGMLTESIAMRAEHFFTRNNFTFGISDITVNLFDRIGNISDPEFDIEGHASAAVLSRILTTEQLVAIYNNSPDINQESVLHIQNQIRSALKADQKLLIRLARNIGELPSV